MVDAAGMSGTDRFLGMFFGGLRGVLIVALLVLGLKQFTPVPKDKWWDESSLLPHMEVVAAWFYEKLGQVVPELKDDNPDDEKASMSNTDAIGALMKMKGLDTSEMKTEGRGEQSSEDEDSSEPNSSTKKDEQN